MLWLAAARESLDDDHAAAAARTWTRQHARLVDCGVGCVGLFWARRHGKQLARVRDVCSSVGVTEQPIMSDAVEALRQHVDQEAADELIVGQRHRFVAGWPFDPIVLVFEGDAVVV